LRTGDYGYDPQRNLYGEDFDRNVGVKSKIAAPRGLNHLWTTAASNTPPPLQ
jgi:hypothetical protein